MTDSTFPSATPVPTGDEGGRARLHSLLGAIWAGGALLMVFLVWLSAQQPGGRSVLRISGVDSVVYYSVARSLLFDHDVNLTNEFEVLKPAPGDWRAPVPQTGLPAILFPIGFSLVQIPWLAGAAVVDWLVGRPVDGYSPASVTAWFAGIVFWLSVGLSALFLWLRDLGVEFGVTGARRDWLAFGSAIVIWPSTTLGYYTFSPMSHVAAFAATTLFLLSWWRARDSVSVWRWALLGAAAAFAGLCRWQELLLLLLPILSDGWMLAARSRRWAADFPAWALSRLAAAIVFGLLMVPQCLEWKAVYGTWVTIPQGQDFLQFPPVFLLKVLFSSQNGWFVWTPITVVGVLGLLVGFRKSPALVTFLLVALGAELVLVGGVLTWHGHWFGLRYLTSMSAVVAVGLFALACSAGRVTGVVLAAVVAGCTCFTMAFAVQYRLDLVPKASQLTVDELLCDKFHLASVYQRHALRLQASEALGRDPARALEIAERASRDYGVDAALIEIRLSAASQLRDQPALARARADQALDRLRPLF